MLSSRTFTSHPLFLRTLTDEQRHVPNPILTVALTLQDMRNTTNLWSARGTAVSWILRVIASYAYERPFEAHCGNFPSFFFLLNFGLRTGQSGEDSQGDLDDEETLKRELENARAERRTKELDMTGFRVSHG